MTEPCPSAEPGEGRGDRAGAARAGLGGGGGGTVRRRRSRGCQVDFYCFPPTSKSILSAVSWPSYSLYKRCGGAGGDGVRCWMRREQRAGRGAASRRQPGLPSAARGHAARLGADTQVTRRGAAALLSPSRSRRCRLTAATEPPSGQRTRGRSERRRRGAAATGGLRAGAAGPRCPLPTCESWAPPPPPHVMRPAERSPRSPRYSPFHPREPPASDPLPLLFSRSETGKLPFRSAGALSPQDSRR